jgi:hypothetical protein
VTDLQTRAVWHRNRLVTQIRRCADEANRATCPKAKTHWRERERRYRDQLGEVRFVARVAYGLVLAGERDQD